MLSTEKARPAFPAMYGLLWPLLVEVARDHGYALGLHGSLARDMDVIAAPWTEDASPADVLVEALCARVGFLVLEGGDAQGNVHRDPTPKPHARLAWALHLSGGAYIDLSVMPRAVGAPVADA